MKIVKSNCIKLFLASFNCTFRKYFKSLLPSPSHCTHCSAVSLSHCNFLHLIVKSCCCYCRCRLSLFTQRLLGGAAAGPLRLRRVGSWHLVSYATERRKLARKIAGFADSFDQVGKLVCSCYRRGKPTGIALKLLQNVEENVRHWKEPGGESAEDS